MKAYDKKTLTEQAQRLAFNRDMFEKVVRLAEILRYMAEDPLLNTALALKGGTAINLTIFDLPRLSVDIDLDYAFNNSLEKMREERSEITRIIQRYMIGEGYELSAKSKSYHSLDSFVYAFTNSASVRDNIKIEINYSLRCHILPLVEQRFLPLDVFGNPEVLCVAPLEIFASKVVALLTRTAARDLFDIDQMVTLQYIPQTDVSLFRRCIVFYTAVSSNEYDLTLERLSILTKYKIRTDLQPVLRKRDWFDLPTALERTKQFLENLLVLEPEEADFLTLFRGGQYKPELLFEGMMLHRVRNHPMAVWRTNHPQ